MPHDTDVPTPSSLKRNQLSRDAKRDQLLFAYPQMDKAERDQILAELYGHEDTELHVQEPITELPIYYARVELDGPFAIIKPTIEQLYGEKGHENDVSTDRQTDGSGSAPDTR